MANLRVKLSFKYSKIELGIFFQTTLGNFCHHSWQCVLCFISFSHVSTAALKKCGRLPIFPKMAVQYPGSKQSRFSQIQFYLFCFVDVFLFRSSEVWNLSDILNMIYSLNSWIQIKLNQMKTSQMKSVQTYQIKLDQIKTRKIAFRKPQTE